MVFTEYIRSQHVHLSNIIFNAVVVQICVYSNFPELRSVTPNLPRYGFAKISKLFWHVDR